MFAALRSLWRGITIFERYGYVFVIANLFAGLLSLPIITAPAAWGGLSRLAWAAHSTPTCHINDFWAGFRAYLVHGLIIGVVTLGLIFILYTNYTTYILQSSPFFVVLRITWLMGLVVWLSVLLYLFPLLERMERPNLGLGLRNALVMTLKNPLFSVSLLVGMMAIGALSTLLIVPWALITLSIIASGATAAVDNRLSAGLVSN